MKLGSRQILFFLAAVAPVGKLILLPPQLAAVAGNDFLFPILAQLLVQAALVFCVLLLSRRERTVYALLEGSIGGVGAKIVTWALALFLLYASFMPLVEQKLLVQSIFYDTIPSYIVFAPFFLLAEFACVAVEAHEVFRGIAEVAFLTVYGFVLQCTRLLPSSYHLIGDFGIVDFQFTDDFLSCLIEVQRDAACQFFGVRFFHSYMI